MRSKNKTTQIASSETIDESCVWKESRTYGLLARLLRIRGYPPLKKKKKKKKSPLYITIMGLHRDGTERESGGMVRGWKLDEV